MPNDALPEVPGFVVTGPVVRADSSDYVSAVDVASRERVALRLLPSLDDSERAAIAFLLELYAAVVADDLDDPVRLAPDADALVVRTRGWRLDTLPAGPSQPGQVTTVVAPVAQAVAALHSAGLAHGNVRAATITVDDDGRPRLGEAGVAAALHALASREVPAPTLARDRDDLLDLLSDLAGPVDDTAFAALVANLVAERAEPAIVSERLLSQVAPVPLGAVEDADQSVRDAPTVAPRRWLWLVLALVVGAAAVGALALVLPGSDSADGVVDGSAIGSPSDSPASTRTAAVPIPMPEPSAQGLASIEAPSPGLSSSAGPGAGTLLCGAPGPTPQSTPPLAADWADVVRTLYVRRTAALVTGQTALLCDVYDPRSPGLTSDLELDAAYREQGVRPDALVFVVDEATLVSEEGALLTIEITDRLEPYRLVDDTGRTVAELPGVPTETWQARLVPDATGSEWVFG